jgi:hypothetical protein
MIMHDRRHDAAMTTDTAHLAERIGRWRAFGGQGGRAREGWVGRHDVPEEGLKRCSTGSWGGAA